MNIKIKKLHERAMIPTFATEGAAYESMVNLCLGMACYIEKMKTNNGN